MRKQTSTKQIHSAITNNLLQITKVEIHHKSSKQVDIISVDSFIESLDFLAETIFADMIGWHYERNLNTDGEYIADSGRMNPHSEDIVIVFMTLCNGACIQNVEKELLFLED